MGQFQPPNPTFNQTRNQLQQQSQGPHQSTQEPKRKDEKFSSQPTEGGDKNFREHRQQEQQATACQTTYVGARTSVLLQTAKVNIYKPGSPENSVNARLIPDSGSQRSYVTSRVRNRLDLNTEGTENSTFAPNPPIQTFSSQHLQYQQSVNPSATKRP